MKSAYYILFLLTLGMFSCKTGTPEKIETFKVWGNCEMCKNTIETSLHTKGIKSANWNVDTKQIAIEYDPNQLKVGELHRLIASEGYDTELEKGDDFAYENLHSCCQYERKK